MSLQMFQLFVDSLKSLLVLQEKRYMTSSQQYTTIQTATTLCKEMIY